MKGNMTEGSPLKLLLKFALPLLLGNLLQQTYNIIDAMIVGRTLGVNALAGVGASSSVQFLVLGFCTGICCGFGIPIAKHFGAGDYRKMRECVFHAIVLTAAAAVILTAVCAFFCPNILHMLSTPEDIYENAYAYLIIIFLGIPFTLLYNLLASILRAVGDSKTPFLFLAIATVLNIALDFLCIIGFQWGCAGAAVATVTAQAVSGVLCLIFMKKKISLLHLEKEDCRMSGKVTKHMLLMGIPMGLQLSITAIGSMVMQSANNGLGSICVSGFTAGMKIKQFAMAPFDAIGMAVSVFCGQNLGAGKGDRIRKGFLQGLVIATLYGALAGLVLIFGGRQLSQLFVSQTDVSVLDAAAKYLRCLGYFFWSLGILAVSRMCTQGLGFSGRAVFTGFAEMLARVIVSLVFVSRFGYTAICFADQAAWISACIYIAPTCFFCMKKCLKNPAGKSGCITTYGGTHFSPIDPDMSDFHISDAAHALSLICRGNGHVKQFFSVGQHCINCALEAEARGYSDRVIMACLLHDASEAYMSDVPRPFKKYLKEYAVFEERLLSLIYQKYLGSDVTEEERYLIKQIDNDILAYDLFYLLGEGREEDLPQMKRAFSYEVRPFEDVEREYKELFEKYEK